MTLDDREPLFVGVTLAFCESGEMSSLKRNRDTEYLYGQKQENVATTPATNNEHIANLLAQARMSGLLLPLTNETGVLPPALPTYPPMRGVSKSAPFSLAAGVSMGWMDQGLQQEQGNVKEGENGVKRRRLNNDKIPPEKRAQRNIPKRPIKSTIKQKHTQKQKQKALGKDSIDPSYVENLIADALSSPNAPSSWAIPKFPSIPKPNDYPPPLPPIYNKALEKQCFTHRSYIHDPMNKDARSSALHYERLEFLGDSYMNYCVTKILFSRLPTVQEGDLTRFRSQIISNDNIRHYAMMYNFRDRILLSSGAEKDDVREAGKKIADIFEAYIGGILTDQPDDGEKVVFKWMSEITAPQVEETEKVARNLLNVNKNAKQELYILLDAERAPAPAYVVTKEGDTNNDFEVACLVQGKEMGRGVGKNKNEAGTRAAMQVLEKLKANTAKIKSENEEKGELSSSNEYLSEGEINISP